jgi:2-amino-4-hydroxy-6-hydroxymethyldihydropteridine diphosphokinase
VNACARIETRLSPRALHDHQLAIEQRHGRVRGIPNGPRTLDLDIVLYGGATIEEPGLSVPHPRAHERAFVLAPLVDAWPEAQIPGKGTAKELLDRVGSEGIEKIVVPVETGTDVDSRRRGNDEK